MAEVEGGNPRERVIVSLLAMHHDFADPMMGPASVRGDGDALPLMPKSYTDSVKELERLKALMRVEARSIWWHTTERFDRCERSRKTCVLKGGRWYGLEPHEAVEAVPAGWSQALAESREKKSRTGTAFNVTVVRWDAAVRLEKVRRGVTWIAERWDAKRLGEPMVPSAVLEDAA